MAAALTEYDSNPEVIEDARYGELVIQHFGWDAVDDVKYWTTDLSHHQCSDEELGLTADGSSEDSYPIFGTSENEIKTFKKKFKCVREEDLLIWGDYNS